MPLRFRPYSHVGEATQGEEEQEAPLLAAPLQGGLWLLPCSGVLQLQAGPHWACPRAGPAGVGMSRVWLGLQLHLECNEKTGS